METLINVIFNLLVIFGTILLINGNFFMKGLSWVFSEVVSCIENIHTNPMITYSIFLYGKDIVERLMGTFIKNFDSINFDLNIVITAIVAFLGWVVVDQLNRDRDRQNKLRDIRMQYLITSFKYLSDASNRPYSPESAQYHRNIESAIADIQLFGTEDQIILVNTFIDESCKTEASLDGLLNDLRKELRKELGLSQLQGNVRWLRIDSNAKSQTN